METKWCAAKNARGEGRLGSCVRRALCVGLLLGGALSARAGDESPAAASDEKPAWRQGIAVLRDGESLDLDSGTTGTGQTGIRETGADLSIAAGKLRFLRTRRIAKGFEPMVAPVSTRPWSELTTDGGRMAAVQPLHEAVPFAVRYVVAPPGVTTWRAAPGDPHCLGADGRIDVWFDERPEYVRYRVERRVGPAGTFAAAGAVDRPPFSDRDVKGVFRYGYRVFGVTKGGEESIPAEVQGTTASRGVFSGSAMVFRYDSAPETRCLDLLRGVPDPEFDIRFVGSVASEGARFADAHDHEVHSYLRPDDPASSPWDVPIQMPGQGYVVRGEPFFVPLRGGGVARCRFSHDPAPDSSPAHLSDFRLDYVVNPDRLDLGPMTRFDVGREADGAVRITLRDPAGFALGDVVVRGPDGGVLRRLRSDGRSAVDAPPDGELYRVYAAAASDPRGRGAAPGEAMLDERPPTPRSGEIDVGYWRGWSFALGRNVPVEDADIATLGGGARSSVQFAGAGGIVNVHELTRWRETEVSVRDLFSAIVAFSTTRSAAMTRTSQANSRVVASEVFVLRCRSGGWAKLARIRGNKADDGNWRNGTATLAYTFNPKEPVFDSRPAAQQTGGLGFAIPIRGGGSSGLPWR